ncbi:MAG: hypothetical protein JXQ96_20075 [Cyclobacteriaceae bacterium]
MKRILYIAMLITATFSSQGISLFKHFCEGKIVSLALYEEQSHSCCDDHKGLCDRCEDQKTVWSLDDFNIESTYLNFKAAELDINQTNAFNLNPTGAFVLLEYVFEISRAPLVWSGRHRSILHQSFLL